MIGERIFQGCTKLNQKSVRERGCGEKFVRGYRQEKKTSEY